MRIMLVDDEPYALLDSMNILKQVMRSAEIVTADNYRSAIALATDPIDIAFLDIEMPGRTGMELAQELMRLQSDINIVFLTGYEHYALQAFKLKASDYLMKPLKLTDVEHVVSCLRNPIEKEAAPEEDKLDVICFDVFSVRCRGCAVKFTREKSKELFAYLIAKRGSEASIEEIGRVLFPDRLSSRDYCWKIASELRKTLKEYNLEQLLIKTNEAYAIDPRQIRCDYYDYLDGKRSWNGLFMEQYLTWGCKFKSTQLKATERREE